MGTDQFHTVLYQWLTPFLEILKRKDLPVSPDTHIQLLRTLETFKDRITAENLPDFLAAVIVKNPEQLKILRQAYNEFPPVAQAQRIVVDDVTDEPKKPPGNNYKYIIAGALLLALLIGWLIYSNFSSRSATAFAEVLYDKNVNHPVILNALRGLEDTTDAKRMRFNWDYGDGTTDSGARVQHTYGKTGAYTVTLKIASLASNVKVRKADTAIQLAVCSPPIQLNVSSARVQTNEPVVITAQSPDSAYPLPHENTWYINEKFVRQNSDTLTRTFDSAGDYTIIFLPNDTTIRECPEAVANITVEAPDALFFNISESGPGINENNNAAAPNNAWLWALGVIGIASLIPLALVSILFAMKNRTSKLKANSIIDGFGGSKKPYEIPFKNQDDLVEDEKELLSLIRVMNRRNPYEQTYLDIPQTINSTIRSEGMVQPVWRTRTRPVEYLVLIDKTKPKNLQARLFEYLLKDFARNGIYFEKYYYKESPEICYNSLVPEGTNLQQLHDRYPNHVLIVFGTGHELINPDYPILNDRLVQLFRKWQHSAICTPVSYSDWGYKEELISKAIMILPADLQAQLLLFRLVENNSTVPGEALVNLPAYSAAYNFDDANEIEKYLNDPFLFQWLCALAAYPLLQWDVMIAIGNALQKTYYRYSEVNYSVLLKLVRISWMQTGSFPGRTRLELLKRLEPKNEKLARETLLKLIDQAAAKMNSSSFAYEQLATQRITNKFLLYANSPNSEYTNEFRDFKTLWEQDKILDVQLITYLKKAGPWSTLIDNNNLSETEGQPIERYLKDAINVKQKKFSKVRNVLSVVTAVSLIMFTALLMGSSKISGTAVDDLFHLTVPASADSGTLSIAAHNCLDLFARVEDSMIVRMPNNIIYSFRVTDSAHMGLDLRNFAGTDSMIRFSIRSDKGVILDTVFKASKKHIELAVLGCPVQVLNCGQWLSGTRIKDFEGAWYDESMLIARNPSYTPVTVQADSINGNRLVRAYICSGDSNQIKAITVNPRGIFEVIQIQLINGLGVKIGFLDRRFSSISDAKDDTSRPVFTNKIYTPYKLTSYTSRTTATELEGTWNSANDAQMILKGNTLSLNNSSWRVIGVNDLAPSRINLHRLLLSNSSGRKWLYIFNPKNNKILLSQLQDYAPDEDSYARVRTVYTYEKQAPIDTISELITSRVLNSLNEIWADNDNYGKFRVDASNRILYYQGPDHNPIYEFSIEEVNITSFNDYQVIAKRQNIYQSFFIKNQALGSFQLGVCPYPASSLSEARTRLTTDCRQYRLMRLFYEKDNDKIYLPLDYKTFTATESAKIRSIQDSNSKYNYTADTVITYLNNTVKRNNNKLDMGLILDSLSSFFAKKFSRSFPGNVFERDYLKVHLKAPPLIRLAKKILWVDDNPINNTAIIAEFRQQAKFTTVQTNAEAYKLLNTESFDLIITDIDRRTEGPTAGLQLIDSLSKTTIFTPVVIYTSIPSMDANPSANKLGSVHLYTVDPNELRRYLTNFLSIK